jgi:hypothetical protein
MEIISGIIGRPVYAGGTSSVHVRQGVSTDAPSLGLVAAGKQLGIATGNLFNDNDYPAVKWRWYELRSADGKLGYVREDLVLLSAPTGGSSGNSKVGETLKTPFDTQAGFPWWAIAAVALCFVLIVFAIVLIKKRKK